MDFAYNFGGHKSNSDSEFEKVVNEENLFETISFKMLCERRHWGCLKSMNNQS